MFRARFLPGMGAVKPLVPCVLAGLVALLALQGCSVYFNAYFNAQKAYAQALNLREVRLNRNPEDTVAVAEDEKAKLERAITKASKVLELYPNDPTYAPKAVFLIAESYLLMQEYERAVQKYEEFLRYYPKSDQVPLAQIHYAKALYFDGKNTQARDALKIVLDGNPQGEIRREAFLLSARMQVDGNSPEEGLALYEKLLAEGAFTTPDARLEAHWQAAQIAFGLKKWELARSHALTPEIEQMPMRAQYRNRKLAVMALYGLGRYQQGIDEATVLYHRKEYRAVRPDLKVVLAQGREGLGDWPGARVLYQQAADASPRTSVAAEAFYRMGDHFFSRVFREDSAQVYFDSAAAAGSGFEYGGLGMQKADALRRIAELRGVSKDTTRNVRPDTTRPHYRDFMMAEIYFFQLARPESSIVHLEAVIRSPVEDSVHTRRALYALAYIEGDSLGQKSRADSLYRVILARYPNTEWAKQSEKNLGLPATVQTNEDRAHKLFLDAEAKRLAGGDAASAVIPAYREVVRQYPGTRDAAQALFVIAFLREDIARAQPKVVSALDSAKAAYFAVNKNYPGTAFADLSRSKLEGSGGYEPGKPSKPLGSDTVSTAPVPSRPAAPAETLEGAPEEQPAARPGRESLDPKNEEDLY